jgi:hypothetical protein
MRTSGRASAIAAAALLGVVLLGAGIAVAIVRCHSPATGTGQGDGGSDGDSTSHPKVVVDELRCDVGTIESEDACRHTFVFCNEGEAPLLLSRGSTNCGCTVTDLPEEPIPPGGRAEVGVSFKLKELTDSFDRGAKIATNDPDRDIIILAIVGRLRRRLAADPARLTFSVESLAKRRSVETVVYSQVWDRFDLAAVKTSLEGMTWRIEPAARDRLDLLGARSGYRVEIMLPADMPDGRFAEWIDLRAEPVQAGEGPRSLQLDVQGRIAGRLTISGQKMDGNHVLRLGAVHAEQSTRETLIMKVRDDRHSLGIHRIETEPAFLRAHVTPYAGGSEKIGLYRIEVEIPPGAPSCAFMGDCAGTVRIRTDHPKLPVIELKVEFAVVGGAKPLRHVATR